MLSANSKLILVLVIIALGLGITVYYKKNGFNFNKNSDTPQQQTQVKLSDPQYDTDLSENQKKLFYNPAANAPQAEKDAHFQLAKSMATDGTAITINGCKATPDVLRAKLNDTITVKNMGSTDIKFGTNSNNKIVIKGGASAKLDNKVMFKHGVGLYGYGCENTGVRRAIGMIIITQ